jgi:hypothetical protein
MSRHFGNPGAGPRIVDRRTGLTCEHREPPDMRAYAPRPGERRRVILVTAAIAAVVGTAYAPILAHWFKFGRKHGR